MCDEHAKTQTGRLPGGRRPWCPQQRLRVQLPTASDTHFLEKLVLAAPASFLEVAVLVQAAEASASHFFMNDLRAAPASFLVVASDLQVAGAAGAAAAAGGAAAFVGGAAGAAGGAAGVDWANALAAETASNSAAMVCFMVIRAFRARGAIGSPVVTRVVLRLYI